MQMYLFFSENKNDCMQSLAKLPHEAGEVPADWAGGWLEDGGGGEGRIWGDDLR